MTNYCAFSKDHTCIKWLDYEITREQLEEADELCHGNWIEIKNMRSYIDQLQAILRENSIEVPIEYFYPVATDPYLYSKGGDAIHSIKKRHQVMSLQFS